jgi:hypothetical protein
VLSVLFALSCVLRVSFVCSLALVHVFRGSLWFLCLFSLLSVVSSPFCLPSRSRPFVSFVCVVGFRVGGEAPCVAYV